MTGARALRPGARPGGAGAQARVCVRALPRAGQLGALGGELAAVSAGQGTETEKCFNEEPGGLGAATRSHTLSAESGGNSLNDL